jgi:hypothetical protein
MIFEAIEIIFLWVIIGGDLRQLTKREPRSIGFQLHQRLHDLR